MAESKNPVSVLIAHAEKCLAKQKELVMKGDSKAMRAVISIEGDIANLKRFSKRWDDGFYTV